MTTPTPEQNAQAIAQLTAAVDRLVTQFIRPALQQSIENQDSITRIIEVLDGHAQAIVQIDARLETVSTQLGTITESLTRYDEKLEETREIVAENSSMLAQAVVQQKRNAKVVKRLATTQEQNAQAIEQLAITQERSVQAVSRLEVKVDSNAEQVRALVEASRSQLAGIIGNGRRIDRLEQQAS